MTSQINPNNIDGNYPVAGQPNNTQGMRDNFTNTKTNLQFAADEISDLQSKVVLKAGLTGTTLDNNMNGATITNVALNDVGYSYLPIVATSGSIEIDYSAAGFQQINPSGPCSLSFTNWPISGVAGTVRVGFNVTNVAQTLTLPATVTVGINNVAGASPGTPGVTNTITFGQIGNYAFEFVTIDGGTNIWIFDDSRPPDYFTANLTIANARVSTSTSTGALVVTGGVGIGGNLNVGGNLTTYTSTGNIAFEAADNGFITINAASIPANTNGALNVVGSTDGGYQAVRNPGSMLHITGNDNLASRITIDAFGSAANAYPILTSRRARGTATSPSAVQTGDVLARVTASGWGTSDYVLGAANVAPTSIDFFALENFATGNSGSSINFYTAPVGNITKTLSANITANVTTFPANVVVQGGGGVSLVDGGTVGYGTGAGGTVAQAGNKSGPVTLNKPSGEITMQNTALGGGAIVSFVLTNSTISNHDTLVLNHVSGGTLGAYALNASCNTGNATIYVRNATAGSLSEALVLRYAVIKGSIA